MSNRKEDMMKYYLCPICGYDKIETPPYGKGGNPSFEICDCCGFEYGYSEDEEVPHKALKLPSSSLEWAFGVYRKNWIEEGAKIFMEEYYPLEFNKNGHVKKDILEIQLQRINIDIKDIKL